MLYLILNPELNNILYDNIYNELKARDINYYYLCADLHQYQSGNIKINNNMNIKQYIVGTAGAKKDEVNKDLLFTTPQTLENIEYFMDDDDKINMTNENGYLKCIADEINLKFEFISLNSNNIGGKRKTHKRLKKGKTRKNKRNKRKTKKMKLN